MNKAQQTYQLEKPSSYKMLRAMVSIGVICALMIVSTFELTFDRIAENKAEALERAIFKVVPGIDSKQKFSLTETGQFQIFEESNDNGTAVYAGYDNNGSLKGFAIEASGMGFADIIRILYGFDPEKQAVTGFYVLESKETPGLGDKIEKDQEFLQNFDALDVSLSADGKTLQNRIVPVKHGEKQNPWEVDCITGATISSRAIGEILGKSTAFWVPKLQEQKSIFKKSDHE